MQTPAVTRNQQKRPGGSDPADEDRAVLDRVENSRADGLALKRWWQYKHATSSYAKSFDLIRNFNHPDVSFGFFDEASLGGCSVPVMGIVETMLYDQPKQGSAEKIRDELREFVLHYFLRISAFEQPEAYAEIGRATTPPAFPSFSWCPDFEAHQSGFGFSQHYYKLAGSGTIGVFPENERSAVVDLREIESKYEWLVAKVRIFDFNFTIRPRGQQSLQFVLPLREQSYLALSSDFITNEDNPEPGVLGRYGFGYAFIKDPSDTGPLAFGPGHFDASFQLITFRVLADGRIYVDLVFVVNRPDRALNLSLAPVDWSFRLADLFSLGMASRLFGPLKMFGDRFPLRIDGFDPVITYIALANLLTANRAAQNYCISKDRLDKDFLVQHFMQHYQMLVGSLLTWRQQPTWLDPPALPPEIVEGVST